MFTVNANDHSYKSSSIGYVIIPKLTNNTYNLTVNMDEAPGTSLTFQCKVNNNDLGFLLKNDADKGWTLMNLQTMDLIHASNGSPIVETKKNAFGEMLSDVVDDSTLNNPVNSPVSPAVNANTQIMDSNTLEVKSNTTVASILQPIDSVSIGNNKITKIESVSDQNGMHYTFLDFDGIKTDTIHVTIPASVKTDTVVESKNEVTEQPVEDNNNVIPDSTNHAANTEISGNPFYKENGGDKVNEEQPPVSVGENTKLLRNECANQFPDEDMDRLRKKMISQSTDDKMIAAALKYIGNRCITTAQVKSLSGLFLNDESRYNLFSQLYANVLDYENYSQLSNLLLDTNYKNRFSALIQQK